MNITNDDQLGDGESPEVGSGSEAVTVTGEGRNGNELVVIVNGRPKKVETEVLTFEEVLHLAFDDPQSGPNVIFTITYRNAKSPKHEGSLLDGQTVEIKDGTIFNVTRTDKS
jgi:hypothetical protein